MAGAHLRAVHLRAVINKKRFDLLFPRYRAFDRKLVPLCLQLLRRDSQIQIAGSKEDIASFILTLISSQGYRDYRSFLKLVVSSLEEANLEKGKLDIPSILERWQRRQGQTREVDCNWAVFRQDVELCKVLKKLQSVEPTHIQISCPKDEFKRFVLLFLLQQFSIDWRGPLFLISRDLLDSGKANCKKWNRILTQWLAVSGIELKT